MIIVAKNPSAGMIEVPEGAIVFWNQGAIPEGWEHYSPFTGAMVKAASSVNTSHQGSWTHVHANQGIGWIGDHTHSGSHRSASGSVGTVGNRGSASHTGSAAVGHSHNFTNVSYAAAGGHSHPIGNTHEAWHVPPFRKLFAIKALNGAKLPLGAIIMFTKSLSTRPEGFNLCNGSSYDGKLTPDMRNRFPYGAENAGELNVTGGNWEHNHGQPNTGAGGGHSHSGSCGTNTVNASRNVYALSAGAVDAIGSHGHSVGGFSTPHDHDHAHTVPATGTSWHGPPLRKLYYLMMTSEDSNELTEGCALFVDNSNNIPPDWTLHAYNRYILGSPNDGELHENHGVSEHGHTQGATSVRGAHNHGGHTSTGGLSWAGDTFNVHQFDPGQQVVAGHSHTGGTVYIDSGGGHQHNVSQPHNASNEPVHIRLLLIEKD